MGQILAISWSGQVLCEKRSGGDSQVGPHLVRTHKGNHFEQWHETWPRGHSAPAPEQTTGQVVDEYIQEGAESSGLKRCKTPPGRGTHMPGQGSLRLNT